ncbi:MAG: addiction module antidote protein [Hyphococcus sp.]
MAVKTNRFDAAKYLETDEDIAAYLDEIFDDGDPALVAGALGAVARAKGMADIAEQSGLGRTSLYKALSENGNPEFATVMKVMKALGLSMKVATAA